MPTNPDVATITCSHCRHYFQEAFCIIHNIQKARVLEERVPVQVVYVSLILAEARGNSSRSSDEDDITLGFEHIRNFQIS